MSQSEQWWRSEAFRRDIALAAARAAVIFIVPALVSVPPLPLGMHVVFSPALAFHWPVQVLLEIAFVLLWFGALTGVHYWFLRSAGWKRRSLIAPIILLTAGPLYWGLWTPWPPTPDEIAEQRRPEYGSWEEVCRWEDYYYFTDATAPAALEQGVAWIGQVNEAGRVGHSILNVETGCALSPVPEMPSTAVLHSGHLSRRALYSFREELFALDAGNSLLLMRPERHRSLTLSTDGEWVAWLADPDLDPDDYGPPYELVVQRLDGSRRRSTLLASEPYPSALLAYDPRTGDAVLESSSNNLLRLDSQGRVLSDRRPPPGCRDSAFATWTIHPLGWAYRAIADCGLVWDFRGRQSKLDLSAHTAESLTRRTYVEGVAISPDAKLLAFSTGVALGHANSAADSVVVIDLESMTELARIHLQAGISNSGQRTVAFLGADHLLVSQHRLVRLIRLHL